MKNAEKFYRKTYPKVKKLSLLDRTIIKLMAAYLEQSKIKEQEDKKEVKGKCVACNKKIPIIEGSNCCDECWLKLL